MVVTLHRKRETTVLLNAETGSGLNNKILLGAVVQPG